jgi:hypothetical protein
MLTLFENYGNVQCGEHFKAPLMPLWVLCSESHYSVLFGATRALSTGAGGDKVGAVATELCTYIRARGRTLL